MIINSKLLLLLLIIFINNIGGTNGAGEENENDLLFGEMWRKAFELNPQNLAQLNSDQKKEEKRKEVKIENEEEDDQKMGEKANKFKRKIKNEPIFDQTEGKESDQKIKKEPKIEANNSEDFRKKCHTESDQNSSAQNESVQSADHDNKTENKKNLAIVNEFEKMRKAKKMTSEYRYKDRVKIESEIAKELGTNRFKIYKWKKEHYKEDRMPTKKENAVKMSLIKKFDKMRKEYKLKNNCKSEGRHKMEREIARELGTNRNTIYELKKELNQTIKDEIMNKKLEIIKSFNKMRKEYKMENKRKDWNKIEREIANKLGTFRAKIYKWKKELYNEVKMIKEAEENKEKKLEIIKIFDKMRKEYKSKNNCKSEDRYKMEKEISEELGIKRDKIYKWKKELCRSRTKRNYTKAQKMGIIEHFDKLRDEFSSKFNVKMSTEIVEKIARKFGVCRRTILNWKNIK